MSISKKSGLRELALRFLEIVKMVFRFLGIEVSRINVVNFFEESSFLGFEVSEFRNY
jgi:hypothetical protein